MLPTERIQAAAAAGAGFGAAEAGWAATAGCGSVSRRDKVPGLRLEPSLAVRWGPVAAVSSVSHQEKAVLQKNAILSVLFSLRLVSRDFKSLPLHADV